MANMKWMRRTHADLIKAMNLHATELEARDERHVYGSAIIRITLLMEHIASLEEKIGKQNGPQEN